MTPEDEAQLQQCVETIAGYSRDTCKKVPHQAESSAVEYF